VPVAPGVDQEPFAEVREANEKDVRLIDDGGYFANVDQESVFASHISSANQPLSPLSP